MCVVYSTGLLAEDFTEDFTVAGLIESQHGGFVFPDGSIQVTAAVDRTPIAVSGVWTSAGLAIFPSTMIIHDLIFFVNSDTSPPCQFTMNYVIDNTLSRTIRQFSLFIGQSAELHFEAGIQARELRFGTIGGGTCVRNWLAMGFAVD
jgi:hypothetical protein